MGISLIAENRPKERGKCGEVAFLVYNSVQFRTFQLPKPIDSHIEQQAIEVTSGTSAIKVVNIYIPPQSSCQAGYTSSIKHLVTLEDAIILGDFNAHSNLCFSRVTEEPREQKPVEEIDESTLMVLNEDFPTRVVKDPSAHQIYR